MENIIDKNFALFLRRSFKMKKLMCLLLLAAVVAPARAFNVSVTDMVGIPAGSTSTVALPSAL